MERAGGPEWLDQVPRPPGTAKPTALDPAFWPRELQVPLSPARATPALQVPPPSFVPRLKEALRVRHAHAHFRGTVDIATTVDRLVVLRRAARELRLRADTEISTQIERLTALRDGRTPDRPTLADFQQQQRMRELESNAAAAGAQIAAILE